MFAYGSTYTLRRPFRDTSKSIACRIYIQVILKGRLIVKQTSHCHSRCNISRTNQDVTFTNGRVSRAITFASLSIENIKPLNFSTDQRPPESVSRSKNTSVRCISLSANFCIDVDSTNNLTVNFS